MSRAELVGGECARADRAWSPFQRSPVRSRRTQKALEKLSSGRRYCAPALRAAVAADDDDSFCCCRRCVPIRRGRTVWGTRENEIGPLWNARADGPPLRAREAMK